MRAEAVEGGDFMTAIPLPVIVMCITLVPCVALFIRTKYRAKEKPTVVGTILKGVSTWIIICVALIGTLDTFGQASVFSMLIIAGLVMGLAGDIAISLSKPDKLGLVAGMFFFGLGHLCYIVALIAVSEKALVSLPVFAPIYVIALVCFLRKRANLGNLFVPVLVYGAVITYMLSLTVVMPFFAFPGGLILFFAGVLFVVSDILLAQNNFSASGLNRATARREVVLLPCYFLAQSLFAVSVYCFG